MVENKTLALVVLTLVLASVFTFAVPFNFQQVQVTPFQLQKAPLQINKQFTLIDKNAVQKIVENRNNHNNKNSVKTLQNIKVAKPFVKNPFVGKLVDSSFIPIGGKQGKENNAPNADELCNTPGFACGGYYRDFEYGSGDVIRYEPTATEGLASGTETWFHLEPASLPGPRNPVDELNSNAFRTVVDNDFMVYGACLTARMEFDSINVPDFTNNDEQNVFTTSQAISRTNAVIDKCSEYSATPRAYSCAYGANPWWNGWKVLNPNHGDDARTLGVTIAYFGEVAACNFELTFTSAPTVEVTSAETGSVSIRWSTSLRSSESVAITNVDTSVVTTVAGSALGPTEHSLTRSGLEPGTYSAVVSSSITESDPLVITQTIESNPVEFIISNAGVAPVLTYVAPTPSNAATLASDVATINVTSNEPIETATLFLTRPDGSTTSLPVVEVTPTLCTAIVTGLRAGLNTYYVEATDVDGDAGVSSTRTFTVPLPSISFILSTPASGSSQTATTATVTISSNEPLASAALLWTLPSGVETSYTMTGIGPYTYTISSLAIGTHSYSVRVTDDEGDSTTSSTRTLVVAERVATPPVITFTTPPTPASGASQTSTSATVTISSNEPLASATLQWTNPDASTTFYAMTGAGTSRSYTVSSLALGTHSYSVDVVDVEGDVATTSVRTLVISTIPVTPPTISFISPTPRDAATLASDSATVQISSNEDLTSASLHLTAPTGTTSDLAMNRLTPRSYNLPLTGLRAGLNTYYVDAVDSNEGAVGTSPTRNFNAPLPSALFISPTPASGATRTPGTSVTISISAGETLTSATLVWTNPDTTTTSYIMTGSGTSFSYTLSPSELGTHSYRVDIRDDEGDGATTATQSLVVAERVATPPVITFTTPPTPTSGTTQTSTSATITISSNEPLASATLQWTNPNSSTTSFTMTGTGTSRSYTVSSLAIGTHTYYIEAVDTEGDGVTTATQSLVVEERIPTPPVITFTTPPTPASGASQTSTSATVSISFNEPLTSATLQWTDPSGTTTPFIMTGAGTSRAYTVSPLVVGTHSYRVDVVDVEGDAATTSARTLVVTPATPPVLTFVSPTLAEGATVVNDSTIIAFTTSEVLSNISITSTDASGRVVGNGSTTPGAGLSFSFRISNMYNGSNTVALSVLDAEGVPANITRTLVVPIAHLLYTFPGEAIASMAVFNGYMYVGTFNETVAGKSHVYRSSNGVTWTLVFSADTPATIMGVYSMAVYDEGTGGGEALYIGTGNLGGAPDGDVWRSFDGTTWEVSYDAPSGNNKINILTVIDGTLYAGTSRASGTGEIMYYNSTNDWGSQANPQAVKSIEKFGGAIYYTSGNRVYNFSAPGIPQVSTIGGAAGANDVLSMRRFDGKLDAGHTHSTIDRFANTSNPITWEYQALTGDPQIIKMQVLSDGHLYMPTVNGMNNGKLFRRTPSESNELVLDPGFNSDTGTNYDLAREILEFNGRKYLAIQDRIGTSGTNYRGYVFKLTN